MRQRLCPDDLLQSIINSVFRVTLAKDPEFRDVSDDNYEMLFWKWLTSVALNKTFKRIARERTQKRDPNKEDHDAFIAEQLADCQPGIAAVVETADLLEVILQRLAPDEQKILQLKLEGHEQKAIAQQLGHSEKYVQRKMHTIREAAREAVGDEDSPQWE